MPIKRIINSVRSAEPIRRLGSVSQFYGLSVEAVGPDVFIGEICEIYAQSQSLPVLAEVVGFKNGRVILMPCGSLQGIRVGSEIVATGRSATVKVGQQLLGRIIDGFGNPMDDKGELKFDMEYPLHPSPKNPLSRVSINEQLATGIKVIDTFTPVGKGQRLGIFAGSGVGKSTLLGMLTKSLNADVSVVALIGERGREVVDFIEQNLGADGLQKTVLVVAGADQPAIARINAANVASSIAEYFCDQGKDVVLAMDSITRFAMAQREIGISVGEPPSSRGYTPSTFDRIPRLLERAGRFKNKGSITAFFTVLVEGDDFNEPISDHVRAILDGHVILDRHLASKAIYPAVDVLNSISRLERSLLSRDDLSVVQQARALLATYGDAKDIIELGGYKEGNNPKIDKSIKFSQAFDVERCQSELVVRAKDRMLDWLRRSVGIK